jgi:hypothetical protein
MRATMSCGIRRCRRSWTEQLVALHVLYWTPSRCTLHGHTACAHSHRSGAADPFTAPLALPVSAAAARPV